MIAPARSLTHSRAWGFFRDSPMDGAIVLFTLVLLGFVAGGSYQSGWGSFLAVLAGLVAAVARSEDMRFRAMLAASLMIGLMLWVHYYFSANHGFMIFWIAVALTLSTACTGAEQQTSLRRNAAILLGLLMAFALIQKLRSSYYLQGDLLGGLLVQGEIYANLLGLILPDWPARLVDYRSAAQGLLQQPTPASVPIAVPALVLWLAGAMTLASLAAQAGLEVALLLRRRLGWLFHLILLGFVAMVYSTRNENIFLSMNCLLGYCLTEDDTRNARPVYALAVLYLILAAKIGLRPWIIS